MGFITSSRRFGGGLVGNAYLPVGSPFLVVDPSPVSPPTGLSNRCCPSFLRHCTRDFLLFRPNELFLTILNLCYTPACYGSDTILNNYTSIQDKGELDKKQAQSPRPKRIGPMTAYTCLDPKQAFVAPLEIYLHLRVESTSASEPIIFVIFFYPSVFFLLKIFFLPVKPVKICQVRLKQHTMQTTTPRQTRQPLQSQVIVKFH